MLGAWGDGRAKVELLTGRFSLHERERLRCGGIDVHRNGIRDPAARFIASEIEKVVDDALHSHDIRLNRADELLALSGAEIVIEQCFGKAADHGEWGFQLMRHIGDEVSPNRFEAAARR